MERSRKTVICIPSYGNRYKQVFNCINDIKNYNVFIILSKNDNKLKEYYNYDFKDHVNLIECDCETIGQKRQFIIDEMNNKGYQYIVQIDDDNRNFAGKITEESKRETSNTYKHIQIPLEELIQKLESVAIKENAAFVSPYLSFGLSFSKLNKLSINKGITSGQFTLVDCNILKKYSISYLPYNLINEDVILLFELRRHNLKCITVSDYCYELISASTKRYNSILCQEDNEDICHNDLYLRYPGAVKLWVDSRNKLRIKIRWKSFPDNSKLIIDNELYKICQSKDINYIKKYILEHQ